MNLIHGITNRNHCSPNQANFICPLLSKLFKMKKKYLSLLLVVAFLGATQWMSAQHKSLVVYFSHSGNTRAVATEIAKRVNGDIFEIKTVKTYPNDYQTLIAEAKKELKSDYRPALQTVVRNINQYDVVFIGYPNWWNTYPQAVKVFLTMHNLAGKTVIPFCTHEGSELGGSVDDLKKMCPRSKMLEGLAIRGRNAHNASHDIDVWLKSLKITK